MALSIHTLSWRRWGWPGAQLPNNGLSVPGTAKVKESSLYKKLLFFLIFCGTLLQTQTSTERKKWALPKWTPRQAIIPSTLLAIHNAVKWSNNLLQPATKTGMKWPAKTRLPASVQIPLPLFSPDSFYFVARKDFSLCSVLLIFLLLGLLWCLHPAAVALQVSAPWEMR